MNKKLIISLVMIGIMAFGAGLGSYAWFTSTATSSDNLFETGTLVIAVGSPMFATGDFKNIYPSWNSGEKTYEVKNDGTLPLKYRMRVEGTAGDLLFGGPTPLQVSINGGAYVDVDAAGTVTINSNLSAGATDNLKLQFRLPEAADNSYQQKSTSLTFVFEATQTDNTGWSETGI